MIKTKIISSLEKVFIDRTIETYPELTHLSALRGERINFQIATTYVTKGSPMPYIAPKYTPKLSGELAKYADLRQVMYVPVNFTTHMLGFDDNYLKTEPGLYPDVLRPLYYGGTITFAKDLLNSVWVEINIPKDMEAGTYDFTIEVDGGEFGTTKSSVTVEVIGATLPDEDIYFTQWFHSDCLANYYNVEVWSDRHFEIVENFIRTARRNGINMILTPIFTPPLDTAVGGERRTTQLIGIEVNKGKYSFDFSLLDRWIEILNRCGVEYIEISHLFTQWGAKHAPKIMATVDGEYKKIFGWETDAHGDEYATFLRTFLPELLAHMKARGDDKRCFFHVSDEPHKGDEENYMASKAIVSDILKDYTIMDALSSIEFYDMGIIEHPIPSNSRIQPFLEANIPGLWTYYCVSQPIDVSNRFHAMPGWRNRSIGMQMYKHNIHGFLQWGYNFYNNQFSGDPINPYYEQSADYAFQGGDAFSVYPAMDGTALESPRLAVFYEGLQDIKAMKLAESLTSHDEVVKAMEDAFGRSIEFNACAKSSYEMLRVREAVNSIIKKSIENK